MTEFIDKTLLEEVQSKITETALWQWVLWVESGGDMARPPCVNPDDGLDLFSVRVMEDPLTKDD